MQPKLFTVYAFDETYQQYVRLMEMESEGLFNLILPHLPYEQVYIQEKRGPRTINKYFGIGLKEVKTGYQRPLQAGRKHPFNVGLVISCGYEIADSNEDGLVDFGEAIRIAVEQHNMLRPTPAERKAAEKVFDAEFKKE